MVRAGIGLAAYVPDSGMGPLLSALEACPAIRVLSVTREEEGLGVVSGAYLGGVRGALLTQTSGMGNSLNALASLNLPQRIPCLLLVTQRGELGEFNPAQVPLGRAIRPILDALGVQHYTPHRPQEAGDLVRHAAELAFASLAPVAVLLPRTFAGGNGA